MAATVTVTGKVGPGSTLTAGVFTGVTYVQIDPVNNMIYLNLGTGSKEIDINAANTVTVTKSGANWTIEIS